MSLSIEHKVNPEPKKNNVVKMILKQKTKANRAK